MNPFDLYKALFAKSKPNVQGMELGINIVLNQWLSLVPTIAPKVAVLVDYFFYIKPEHYFYLLYFSVPKGALQFVKKPKSVDTEQDQLLERVRQVIGWTDREMNLSKQILKETILKRSEYWKDQLGIK